MNGYICSTKFVGVTDRCTAVATEHYRMSNDPCTMSMPLPQQGNFEFGISRIIKSLEPYEKKLGTDTWFYAKRCFLALAEQVKPSQRSSPKQSCPNPR